ncbi:type II toxin-antitoxin system HicB family antitoxin [Ensifer aridi]|uniref:type II toxin-antitoxin system HicB family antitoxin n=1 Tax=Ensifer aridi TaxID=1708715 RepID=UPI000A1187B0|nr:type II toxin-antitoxin system HicB family antitoxin [Ensifer aridi]
MRNYIGLIHKDAESDYGVSFPDFPGVVTAGTDLDNARAMAEEALALHIEGLAEDGEAIPEPSSLEAVMSDPENQDGVAILVAVKTGAKKAVRVNVTLPEDVLNEIDAFAEAHGLTRSGFLARAARHEMQLASDEDDNHAEARLSA